MVEHYSYKTDTYFSLIRSTLLHCFYIILIVSEFKFVSSPACLFNKNGKCKLLIRKIKIKYQSNYELSR